jgi:hypothetical protein
MIKFIILRYQEPRLKNAIKILKLLISIKWTVKIDKSFFFKKKVRLSSVSKYLHKY